MSKSIGVRGLSVPQFVNSFVNQPGNIGMRTGHVLRALRSGVCICRGTQARQDGVAYFEMGWLGQLPRLMNAVRIYLAPWYNHRPLDIRLFEWFALRQLARLPGLGGLQVAHVWDACPGLIRQLQARGLRVVVDVPIAPLSYGRRMRLTGQSDFLLDDQRLLDIELEAYAAADHLIAPSEFVADELTRAGVPVAKITIVEFGVQLPDMPTAPRPAKVGLDFCFVGNVSRRKGIQELVSAWSDPDFSEDRLHLCGRLFPDVRQCLAGAAGGQLLTPGFVDPFDYLRRCDVFVLPSWLEGSSKAVFEAMACGLPAIVSHSTGSVVRDGIDGFVIDAGDVAALRERMQWFKQHPERVRSMGDAARARARQFTWPRYADRVLQVYAELSSAEAEGARPVRCA